MLDLVLLSLRNIFRNARRTAITVFSIVVGFAAMACFGGFIQFSFEGLRESTIRTQLGHLPDLRGRLLGRDGSRIRSPSSSRTRKRWRNASPSCRASPR